MALEPSGRRLDGAAASETLSAASSAAGASTSRTAAGLRLGTRAVAARRPHAGAAAAWRAPSARAHRPCYRRARRPAPLHARFVTGAACSGASSSPTSIGLVILLGGILYLSQYHAWLIDAKRESLQGAGRDHRRRHRRQRHGRDRDRIVLDPDTAAGDRGRARARFRDDGFAALELSIQPERVTPILRRLIQPTEHARAHLCPRRHADRRHGADRSRAARSTRNEPTTANDSEAPKTQNIWTRLTRYLLQASRLPVYHEIGVGNGTAYPEVRAGAGRRGARRMLLLNREGRADRVDRRADPPRQAPCRACCCCRRARARSTRSWRTSASSSSLLAAIALLATLLASLLLARTIAGPMRRLSDAAEHVSHNITARARAAGVHGPHRRGRRRWRSAFRAMTERALPAHRGQREIRRRRRARAEEPADRRALDRRSPGLCQDRGAAQRSWCGRSRTS